MAAPGAPVDGLDRWSKWLSIGSTLVGLLASVLGFFVTLAGGTQGLVREYREHLLVAFLLLAAGLLSIAIYLARSRSGQSTRVSFSRASIPLLPVGIVGVFLAALVLLVAALSAPSQERRPYISANVVPTDGGQMSIQGTVETSGLRAGDVLHLRAHGKESFFPEAAVGETVEGQEYWTLLASADVGAGSDGAVSLPVNVRFNQDAYWEVTVAASVGDSSPGLGPCETATGGASCIAYPLRPPGQPMPALSAEIEQSEHGPTLVMKLDLAALGQPQSVLLGVYPAADVESSSVEAPPAAPIYQAFLTLQRAEDDERTIRVPIAEPGPICVGAIALNALPQPFPFRCGGPGATWVYLNVPGETSPTASDAAAPPSPAASAPSTSAPASP